MESDSLILVLVAGFAIMALILTIGLVLVAASLQKTMRQRQLTTSKTYDVHVEGAKVLTEMDMGEVEKEARDMLLDAGQKAAKRLQESLNNTVDQISVNINDMTNNQVAQEFEKYQVSLQALRDQSIAEFTKLQKELEARKVQLLEHIDQEVVKEREKRMDEFNQRLNDVVASYLTESLGNQVDLGAQSTYIFAALEQHKEDIKRDVISS